MLLSVMLLIIILATYLLSTYINVHGHSLVEDIRLNLVVLDNFKVRDLDR